MLALRRGGIRAIWHLRPLTHFANLLVVGLIESSPCTQSNALQDRRRRSLDDCSRAGNARTLGLAGYDPASSDGKMVSLAKAAAQFGICVGSAKTLVLKGTLPATQAIKGSQWLVPAEALNSEAVRIAVQRVIERRPKNYIDYQ